VAVSSVDSRVDAVGACVGIRGSRIKNIVEEVAGEKIDIVRFNESPQVFIGNALKPAEVKEILLNRDINRATVLVADDQLSLAIGKKGQNVRLAARLTGWNIDILTPTEYESQRGKAIEQLSSLAEVGVDMANDLVGAGYISLADVAEVEAEDLARITGVTAEQAVVILAAVGKLVQESEVKAQRDNVAARLAAAEAKAAEAESPVEPAAEGAEVGAEPQGPTEPTESTEASAEPLVPEAEEVGAGPRETPDSPVAPELPAVSPEAKSSEGG
jgi:N utilization substance protein A